MRNEDVREVNQSFREGLDRLEQYGQEKKGCLELLLLLPLIKVIYQILYC